MEENSLKSIDFQNLSVQSLGEVNPDARLEAVEKKVKETFAFAKKYKEKGQKLPFNKLLPFLNNINAISQHNYKFSNKFSYKILISILVFLKIYWLKIVNCKRVYTKLMMICND